MHKVFRITPQCFRYIIVVQGRFENNDFQRGAEEKVW
jgi:hypothetical protein